jgi:hypothetical protein
MEDKSTDNKANPGGEDVRAIIRSVIEEFVTSERQRSEPAHKVELAEERKRREQLERRVNELVEDAKRSRSVAEQAERHTQIRSELQRLGVGKLDLAFKAVRDDITRSEDGSLVGRGADGPVPIKEFLSHFVSENPELLPARIAGGAGTMNPVKAGAKGPGPVDLDRIRPGMSPDELQRVREQISQVANQTMRGE